MRDALTIDDNAATCAAALFDSAMLGGPDNYDEDPILKVLYWHARQYMHGVCTLMAIHLNETRGLPAILLEGRPEGEETWQMRHAAVVATSEPLDIAAMDDGYAVPILDAAGGGTFGDRAELYGIGGWDFRVVLASGSDNRFSRLMASPRGQPAAIEDHVQALPGLSKALGLDFDLRSALKWIVDQPGAEEGIDHDAKAAVLDMLAGTTPRAA